MRSLKQYIEEIHQPGAEVVFPHPKTGKMVSGKVVRHEKGSRFGGSPFYVIYHDEHESAKVPAHKVEKYATFHEETQPSYIPGTSKWSPAIKTLHNYQGQINGKTFVVPHSSVNIYRKGGYAEPMRHAIITSQHHVQHNNPNLTPEEVARVHSHIKDIHGGQEPAKLHESQYHYTLGGEHQGQYITAKDETEAHKKVVKRHGTAAKTLKPVDFYYPMRDKQIKEGLDEAMLNEVKGLGKSRYQAPNPYKVGDKVKLHSDALKHHAQSVPAHAGYSKEGFAWRKHLEDLHGHTGIVSRVFDSGHTNVDFHSGTIGIEHKSLVPHTEIKESSMNEGIKSHSVAAYHQTKIAKQTLRMNDVGVNVMGGPSKEEARAHLKKSGWTDKQIHQHEHGDELNEGLVVHGTSQTYDDVKKKWSVDYKSYRVNTDNRKRALNHVVKKLQKDFPHHKEHEAKIDRDGDGLNEESEQLDELSKSTLGSYVKKSSTDIANRAFQMGADRHKTFSKGTPSWKSAQQKTHELRGQQILKRRKGLSTAVGKLTNENYTEDRRFKGGSEMTHRDSTEYSTWGQVTHHSDAEAKADRDKKAKEWKSQGHKVKMTRNSGQIYDPEGPHTTSGTVYKVHRLHESKKEEAEQIDEITKKNRYLDKTGKFDYKKFAADRDKRPEKFIAGLEEASGAKKKIRPLTARDHSLTPNELGNAAMIGRWNYLLKKVKDRSSKHLLKKSK